MVDDESTDCSAQIECGLAGCSAPAKHIVSVFIRGLHPLCHDVDSLACDEHVSLPGVLKIGELVVE